MNVYESPEARKRRLERERRNSSYDGSSYSAPIYDYSSAFNSGSCDSDSSSSSSDSGSSSCGE